MGSLVKKGLKNTAIRSTLLRRALISLTSHVPRVFVYHRFTAADQRLPHRLSRDIFAAQLEWIKAEFQVMSFAELLDYFYANNVWPKNAAVITVDDGYRDFYDHAFPELQRLGLKATFFVTVNFIDQKIWLWPDRLEYGLQHTEEDKLNIVLHNEPQTFFLKSAQERQSAWKRLSDYCIMVPEEEKCKVISSVERALGVVIPSVPPPEYAAVDWAELRELAVAGIEISSHTMNHPLLSQIDNEQLHHEISMSKTVLERKIGRQVRTFCYPNSQPGDINEKVIAATRTAGYSGAPFWRDLLHFEPFQVPRMGVTNDQNDFLAKLAGLEYLGQKLRSK